MSDLKEIHSQRAKESIRSLFDKSHAQSFLFLCSSSDLGVIRNNGRSGARYAPQSLLFHFKKMTQDYDLQRWSFKEIEVSSQKREEENFHKAQEEEVLLIKKANPLDHNLICHIGGGHDHIYPLVKALKDDFSKVIIINVDAHADTRTDQEFHSGTPFRQLDAEMINLKILQVGLHPYANSFSTLSPLKGDMEVLWKSEYSTHKIQESFKQLETEVDDKTLVVFSLDADALSAQFIPGVSAVNADGFSLDELKEMMGLYLKLSYIHPPVLGIYELNPVYDSLSGISMSTISNFIFHTVKTFKG